MVLKDSEVTKLEESNRRLHEQLQSAMDDVGEKTSELETVSIESGVVNIELVVSIEFVSVSLRLAVSIEFVLHDVDKKSQKSEMGYYLLL